MSRPSSSEPCRPAPIAALLLIFAACGGSAPRGTDTVHPDTIGQDVQVNGVGLSSDELDGLAATYHVVVRDGHYWYDTRSGLFGVLGGPPLGVFVAGLELGGPLSPSASRGATGVFINGRELHAKEVSFLSRVIDVVPGRYWLDADGATGVEGNDTPILNLWDVVRAAAGGGGGGDAYYGDISRGTYANSQGGCSYVMVDGASASVGCG